ncbi:tripartite motif protein, putative [Plasmodium vinckei vinckei]|uniref:Tripartite motif protein, putative n=1 Tax=Plasmodium vinckei vinckei TaxID=54757 RepID=A0A449BZC9_PLAVN|nr:tripartite motif protein, putative [Plasmodium vinckei vinckei]VEV58840.1 tripartite motif protein, putative [Plasmodium vinckei vinckei]
MDSISSSNNDINSEEENGFIGFENGNTQICKEGTINESCETQNNKTYRCAYCSRKVEDVLICSCKHLMCLICASLQLQEKYNKFMKACSSAKIIEEKNVNYKINESFRNCIDIIDKMNDDKIEDVLKKEKIGYVTCNICNIKNKLTIDTLELLTKVGLFSPDVLNIHTFYFNLIGNNNNKKIKGLTESYVKQLSLEYEESYNNDLSNSKILKNDKSKHLPVSNNKYNYLEEYTDDLDRYSYICNICSFNEAIIYCNDCIEYLCENCCKNIHEINTPNGINRKTTPHDYYKIDKKTINLKKLVKPPKMFLNITKEDIEIIDNTDRDSFDGYFSENGENKKNTKTKNFKVDGGDDSDFDNYDEKYFYEKQKKMMEKQNKKNNNIKLSHKLNNLVENMKNESSYDSEHSTLDGTLGSISDIGANLLKKKKKKGNRHIHKKNIHRSNIKYGDHLNGETKMLEKGKKNKIGNMNKEESIFVFSNDEMSSRVDISSNESSINSCDSYDGEIFGNKSITSIENIRCNHHYNYPIQYFCHTCCTKCFCSECAINGIHTPQCNIENINAAFITVLNNYLIQWNEIINELMNDLEVNFYESLEDTRNDWSSVLSECYYNISSKINYIINNMHKMEKDIFNQLDTYMEIFKKDNLDYVELLSAKYDDIENTISIIRANKFQKNPIDLIKFYNNNINIIDRTLMLNKDFKPIEDLSKIRESKIFYMDLYTSQIISYLKHLQVFLSSNFLAPPIK